VKNLIKLSSKNIFSVDTRGKPMNRSTFYNQISKNIHRGNELRDMANIGFYKAGQLLVKAKKELGNEFGKLKKQLANDGLHEKQQERYMAIAKNPDIKLLYNKLPPEWTFWEKLTRLIEQDEKNGTNNFQKVKHLIDPNAKWKSIEHSLGKNERLAGGNRSRVNERDNRTEIFGFEYDFKVATKKHKDEFIQFEKEVKKLASKFKFIKLKEKNYLDDAKDILNEDRSKTKDDTTKEEVKSKMRSYNPKKKIDL